MVRICCSGDSRWGKTLFRHSTVPQGGREKGGGGGQGVMKDLQCSMWAITLLPVLLDSVKKKKEKEADSCGLKGTGVCVDSRLGRLNGRGHARMLWCREGGQRVGMCAVVCAAFCVMLRIALIQSHRNCNRERVCQCCLRHNLIVWSAAHASVHNQPVHRSTPLSVKCSHSDQAKLSTNPWPHLTLTLVKKKMILFTL